MFSFIKRNVKFVVTIGISVIIIAGLTTALIITNAGRGGGRERSRERVQAQVELTEEQIAERVENARERLAQKLADGTITQEEYDERLAAIESGECSVLDRNRDRGNRRGSRDGDTSPHRSERGMTDEQKADESEPGLYGEENPDATE